MYNFLGCSSGITSYYGVGSNIQLCYHMRRWSSKGLGYFKPSAQTRCYPVKIKVYKKSKNTDAEVKIECG